MKWWLNIGKDMGLKAWIEESGGVSVGLLWRSLVYMDGWRWGGGDYSLEYNLQGREMKAFLFLFLYIWVPIGMFYGVYLWGYKLQFWSSSLDMDCISIPGVNLFFFLVKVQILSWRYLICLTFVLCIIFHFMKVRHVK